jgi:hypothetical protein
MQVEDRMVDLASGMAVTVEIKTGQRRIIEYLLSPLLRYRHEASVGWAMARLRRAHALLDSSLLHRRLVGTLRFAHPTNFIR